MVQFYVLAILLNFIGGALLAADYFEERFPILVQMRKGLEDRPGLRVSLIILTVLVGIFKLLTVTSGDVPVVGDLLPALSLFLLGFIQALDYYIQKSDVGGEGREHLEKIFIANQSVFGVAAMVIAVLHFLFPAVLFL
ncbi:hypothetical protein [Sediminispirochaeta smaragdinae]|jgi:hypothetical protein|uniref:Uncharacterized protein n=1 Tax=Sediminispirochaeta smaragdinae (strain DSM 11293 / JCM 15392 / SEBR 4228) TaxID=573413 RepID=E1R4J0_SEDSS|nr:hypothetical protein [Sediminispirochaeta smaragdinae]ADK81731.1 conserved hypothetical protein [Sediminispirochaeta smaragdinae DSM 11293]